MDKLKNSIKKELPEGQFFFIFPKYQAVLVCS